VCVCVKNHQSNTNRHFAASVPLKVCVKTLPRICFNPRLEKLLAFYGFTAVCVLCKKKAQATKNGESLFRVIFFVSQKLFFRLV